jgi:hypothetical protein
MIYLKKFIKRASTTIPNKTSNNINKYINNKEPKINISIMDKNFSIDLWKSIKKNISY